MTVRARLAASLLALVLLGSACTGSGSSITRTEAPVPSSPETVSPVPSGPGSAQAALRSLCKHPASQPVPTATPTGPAPPAIALVEQQLQQIRDLRFTHPVPVDAVTHAELVKGLQRSFDSSYPAKLYDRRSLAWRTIGAIPEGASIRRALEEFATSQVIGYYDSQSKQLVFMGAENPTPFERVTLAHELTHAIDDQHYDLGRLDALGNSCRDEAFEAGLATVEGDATYFMLQYAQRFLTLNEQIGIAFQPVPSITGIPPFIVRSEEWPYTAGLAFIQALVQRGGIGAIDRALAHLPVSTEQIIHPERYPNDLPQPVDVPDLGPKLGKGWTDLNVMGVGEEFLSILLGLRLDQTTADRAAAGWDGGIYRAWSDGHHVALVLSTVWDTPNDATEFAAAMSRWIDAGRGQAARVLPVAGQNVRVLFASDPGTLTALEAAV